VTCILTRVLRSALRNKAYRLNCSRCFRVRTHPCGGLLGNLWRCAGQELWNMPRVAAEIAGDGRRLRRVHTQFISRLPLEGKMDYIARLGDYFQRTESITQHLQLARYVTWRSQRQPEGVLDGGNSRHSDARGQLRHHGERNRAEPCSFDLALDQSYGPATNRSNGNQHHCVHFFFAKMVNNARHALLQQRFRAYGVAHVGIMRQS